MPGLLSSMFGGSDAAAMPTQDPMHGESAPDTGIAAADATQSDDGGTDSPSLIGGPQPVAETGDDALGQSSSGTVEGGANIDLAIAVAIDADLSGSYQNLDGSTTTWSADNSVAFNADVGAALHGVASYDMDSYDAG